jgi:predicted transcriptional regulator
MRGCIIVFSEKESHPSSILRVTYRTIYIFWGEEMSILTKEQQTHLIRALYEMRLQEPRLSVHEMARSLGAARNTVYRYLNHALDKGILFKPQLRLKMFRDVKEYVYAVSSDSAHDTFQTLKKKNSVCYELFATGYIDLLIMSDAPLSRKGVKELGDIRIEGPRSDFICPVVPAVDYETALHQIETHVQNDFCPSRWDVEYSPRSVVWKPLDYDLFSLLRYDLTVKYTVLARSARMSFDGFRWSLDRILANTQIVVPYYPEGYSHYVRFLLMFRSRYENLLIELFSFVPCCTILYKVGGWIMVHFKILPLDLTDWFFNMLYNLQDSGYIDCVKTAVPILHWRPG